MARVPKTHLTLKELESSSEPIVLVSKVHEKKPKKPSVEPVSPDNTRRRTTRAQARATARARVSSASSESSSISDARKTTARKARTQAFNKIRQATQKSKSSSKAPSVKRNEKSRKNSKSVAEKEFSKHKMLETYVTLTRLVDLEKDYTHRVEDSSENVTENLTKSVEFHLKNIIRTFCNEIKYEAKKLMNEAEKIEKNYNYASQLTISDSVCAIIDCRKVMDDFVVGQSNYKKKLSDDYEKWCKKSSVKNIFVCDEPNEPVAGPSKKLTTAEENLEKPPETNTTKKLYETNALNSIHTLRDTSTPINDAPATSENNSRHSGSRTSLDMFSDDPETKAAKQTADSSSDESEFELPPRRPSGSRSDSEQSVATLILDENNKPAVAMDIVQTPSPTAAQLDDLDSSGSVVESSFNMDDEKLPTSMKSLSRVAGVPEKKTDASGSSSDTDIDCPRSSGSQAAVLTLSSESESGKDNASSQEPEKSNPPNANSPPPPPSPSPPPPPPPNEGTLASKPVTVCEKLLVGKEAVANLSRPNSELLLVNKQVLKPVIVCEKLLIGKEAVANLLRPNSELPSSDELSETAKSVEATTDASVVLDDVSKEILEREKAAKARLLSESSESEASNCDSPLATDTEDNCLAVSDLQSSVNRESSPEPGEIVDSTEIFRPNRNSESAERKIDDVESFKSKNSPEKCKRKNDVDLSGLEYKDMEARAKRSLLATSSESESEKPDGGVSSPSVDANLKKSHTDQLDSDSSSTELTLKVNNSRFDKRINKYYRSDAKLRAKCRVKLETLPQRILAQHENILQRHRDYREYKEISRYMRHKRYENYFILPYP